MSGTQELVPEFTVNLVKGPFERTIYDVVVKEVVRHSPHGEKIILSSKIEPRVEYFDTGIMVEFPRGHSIMIATDDHEQIARLGLLRHPKLVDFRNGESELLSVAEQTAAPNSKRGRKEGGLDDI